MILAIPLSFPICFNVWLSISKAFFHSKSALSASLKYFLDTVFQIRVNTRFGEGKALAPIKTSPKRSLSLFSNINASLLIDWTRLTMYFAFFFSFHRIKASLKNLSEFSTALNIKIAFCLWYFPKL